MSIPNHSASSERPSVLLSLSGGADSATLLARYLDKGRAAEAVFFNYGSKQNDAELHAAKNVARHYGIALVEVDLRALFKGSASAMMKEDGRPIPHSGYDRDTMSQTVVPGRNTVFASVLAAMAESRGAAVLALGVHGGDHYLYPDCRPEYIASLKQTIALSSDGKVTVEAPFLHMDKAAIIALGLKLGVPYGLTRSCYTAGDAACGRCGTCVERLEAFRENGVEDPVAYLTREEE